MGALGVGSLFAVGGAVAGAAVGVLTTSVTPVKAEAKSASQG